MQKIKKFLNSLIFLPVFFVFLFSFLLPFLVQADVATISADPAAGSAPLDVNFTVYANDSSENSGVYYTIVFGDGQAAGFPRTSVPTLSHTYSVSGTFTATVTKRTQCSSWECLGSSETFGTIQIRVNPSTSSTTAKDPILVSAGYVDPCTDIITVFISNPDPTSLKLKVEYKDHVSTYTAQKLDLKKSGKGTATLIGVNTGNTYQYRLVDTTGVLLPSNWYSFTTSFTCNQYAAGGYGSGGYQSYPVYYGSNGSGAYATSTTPIPATPPNYNSATDTYNTTPSNTIPSSTNSTASSTNSSPSLPSVPITLGGGAGSSPTLPYLPTSSSGSGGSSFSTITNPYTGGIVPCDNSANQPCNFNAFMDLINRVIHFILFAMVVPIAAVMFAYAGFKMVTSGGSSEARGQAKNIFTNAVIGLVIAIAAWLIIREILSILGYDGTWIFDKFK